jgi:hypothetical protein
MVYVESPAVSVGPDDDASNPTVGYGIDVFAGDRAGPKVNSAVKVVVAQLGKLPRNREHSVQGLMDDLALCPKGQKD